jgi:hypothetical protein
MLLSNWASSPYKSGGQSNRKQLIRIYNTPGRHMQEYKIHQLPRMHSPFVAARVMPTVVKYLIEHEDALFDCEENPSLSVI